MKRKSILLFTLLALTGCVRLSDRGFDHVKFAADANKGATIRLTDYSSFTWDRVHIFGPYTPEGVIASEVGRGVPFPHALSEEHCLLVFLSGGKISAAFEVERKPADFAQLFRKGGYSREEAVFKVEIRDADQWKYLASKASGPAPQPANAARP